jgi:hypothetical protein
VYPACLVANNLLEQASGRGIEQDLADNRHRAEIDVDLFRED